MFILRGVFFLFNIQFVMVNFIDPRCFWKIHVNEVKDEDLGLTCSFLLAAVQTPIGKDYVNQTLNVLKTTKNHKYALSLAYSVDEINRNPDLLPNMSLIIKYTLGHCDGEIGKTISYLFHKKKGRPIPNYFCNEESMCQFLLTGPDWKVSLSYWNDLDSFLYPRILQLTFGPFHSIFSDDEQYPYLYQMAPFVQAWFDLRSTDLHLVMPEWKFLKYETSASNCKILKKNSFNASLDWLMEQKFDMAFSDGSHNIYNAVYSIAHALHEINLQQADNQAVDNGKGAMSHCLKVNSFLRKTHFTNPLGDKVFMKQRVTLQEDYDIFHFGNLSEHLGIKVKLGKFSPYFPNGRHFHLYVDMIELSTGTRKMPSSVCSADCSPGFRRFWKEGMAACCFVCSPCPENEISNGTNMDQCMNCPENQYANSEQNKCIQKGVTFLSYEDPLGMALALMAFCFSAFTAVVLWVFVKHHDTPIVKANNRMLSYLLLVSLMSCFLCSFFFIGHPNRATCILQQITFGIVFTVAVSTVLAKTVTVVLAFKVTDPGKRLRNFLVSGTPNYIIPICSLFQCILCAIWLAVSPPFVDIDEHSQHGRIIIVCNKGSVTAFYSVLGYLACLALGSFTVAFLAKNLPDTFNEAKFLTFSMLVFCSVWVTFLPVYHSTKGKVMVAVEIFSILASSAGMLGCIFAPKIYIILMRPERNSIQKIREKSYF
ncbi:vomeronasal type-2 receptor 116-like [Mastomys coucha]|uniref:vomeronasal type-2 receptor 116-like n=1 Tax=Mastomys coucha TaxID=35658 RepID=UPI0012621BCE|nr:vomeronasal type-2 receptor 116-like [Mastomys coucha]